MSGCDDQQRDIDRVLESLRELRREVREIDRRLARYEGRFGIVLMVLGGVGAAVTTFLATRIGWGH